MLPVSAVLDVVAVAINGAQLPLQGALEALFLPMCLVVTAGGIAYARIALLQPRSSRGAGAIVS